MIKILIGVVIAAFVVIIGFLIIDPDLQQTNTNSVTEVVTSTQNGSKYTIEGEVNKAGTYVLADSITMADLIEAAGGVNKNADELAYFGTAPLKAGSTYYIAGKYIETYTPVPGLHQERDRHNQHRNDPEIEDGRSPRRGSNEILHLRRKRY